MSAESSSAFAHLSAEDRRRAEALAETFRRLGAGDPEAWALSEVEDGIPQLARFIFLRRLWRGAELRTRLLHFCDKRSALPPASGRARASSRSSSAAFWAGPPLTDRDRVDDVPRRRSAPDGHHPAFQKMRIPSPRR